MNPTAAPYRTHEIAVAWAFLIAVIALFATAVLLVTDEPTFKAAGLFCLGMILCGPAFAVILFDLPAHVAAPVGWAWVTVVALFACNLGQRGLALWLVDAYREFKRRAA